ncbi:LysE family translocator [Marinomonas posidonica]|uniref:Lysine exporter protein (LYSE/YGGA) n=1 Tax=Marinomonas posidonica (strain CECT 7376 / NCIMB 14433 / IVIA-Po-181) TaxID=491952 RepID=F6CWH3_MARPP|nr:LysE family translocator [Marinomonas posidonica]AEF53228.1 Lysine exporter protein (LYSE/YGGA) [Marinomonas posidonica IVIA-Po-181]
MLEHFQWLPFLLAISVLTMSPGVDTILVMRNTALGGWRLGFLSSLGICLGLFAHATVSALGLSVILLGSAGLFTAFKLLGAAYLVYLGVQALRSAAKPVGLSFNTASDVHRVTAWSSFRQGILSNVLNPKPIVFYMAFLPQFIDPSHSALVQSLFMASLHFMIAMVWQMFLALMIHRARVWLARPKVAQVMDSLTGVLLVGFGVKLALSQR